MCMDQRSIDKEAKGSGSNYVEGKDSHKRWKDVRRSKVHLTTQVA